MSITTLTEIGLKAIRLQEDHDARKLAAKRYGVACKEWKNKHGYGYIERKSITWIAMQNANAEAYEKVREAKAAEQSARDRVLRACRRLQGGGQ